MTERTVIRSCVACRQKMDQARLNRVVVHGGKVVADPLGNLPGRGAYVCSSFRCLNDAIRSGGFSRALRTKSLEANSEELLFGFMKGLQMQHERLNRAGALVSAGLNRSEKKESLLSRLGDWKREVEHTR